MYQHVLIQFLVKIFDIVVEYFKKNHVLSGDDIHVG
jgi:hypothetical protein